MSFESETPRYSSLAPVTPYQQAAQEWDRRTGDLAAQIRTWRIAFFCMCAISAPLLGIVVYQLISTEIRPYVVEVSDRGQVLSIAPIPRSLHPNQAQVAFLLESFVNTLHSVPMDPVYMRKEWQELYRYVTRNGAETLTRYIHESKPFEAFGKSRASVTVNNVIQLSEESYQVQWHASQFDLKGVLNERNVFTGIFLVRLVQPSTSLELEKNPLGIYIDNFEIRPAETKS